MFRVTNNKGPWLAIALVLLASTAPGPRQAARAAERLVQAAPFDLSLVVRPDDREASGVVAVRPAAILNRPALTSARKLINAQIDTFAAPLKLDRAGIHIEDVEQVMGRIYFRGENKTGKRSLMMSFNVLRTNRDIDWVKLRDACGVKLKQHVWKGETFASTSMSSLLGGLTGVKGDICLWAADSRTLVVDSEDRIKALIEAKTGGERPPLPAYAAGWDAVSRGMVAVALDNRQGRLIRRTMTDGEMKEALADPNKQEYHFANLFKNMSALVVGFGGQDDFHFDLRVSADTSAEAARVADSCKELVAIWHEIAENTMTAAPNLGNEAGLHFLRRILRSAAVRRRENVITLHAETAQGLNTLLTALVKEWPSGKE